MPIEIAVLATTVVAQFLVPYLKLGAEKLTDSLATKLGEEAAEHTTGLAGRLWERVQALFTDPQEEAKLGLFRAEPDELAASVERSLREKLAADPELAAELEALVSAPAPGGVSTGAQITDALNAAILDARGATISGHSTVAAVIYGSAQPPTGPSRGDG